MNTNPNFNTMVEFYNRLVNGSTSDAIFVCSALEEHAKNIPLRNDVIIEFYEFSLQLFDRVFGEDATGRSDNDLPPDWNMLRCGGWLRKLASISCYISSDSNSTTSHASKSLHPSITPQFQQRQQQQTSSGMTQTGLQLVNILSFNSNVMDILKRGNGYFNLDLKLLPSKIRDLLLGQDDASIQNIIQYEFSHNLRQLRLFFLQSGYLLPSGQQLSLPPFHYFLILLARYPCVDENILNDAIGDDFSSSSSSNNNNNNNSTTQHVKKVQRLKPNMGIILLLQSNPYFSLLRHYLNVLLPRYKSASGEAMVGLKNESELFLRIAVECWMNCAHVVRNNHTQYHHRYVLTHGTSNVTPQQQHQHRMTMKTPSTVGHGTKMTGTGGISGISGGIISNANMMDSLTTILPYSPLIITLVDDNPPPYITPSLQCTYLLLVHLLSDPKLPSACEYTAATRYNTLVATTAISRGSMSGRSGSSTSSKTSSTAAVTLLPSLQDMYAFMNEQEQLQQHQQNQSQSANRAPLSQQPVCPVALNIIQESLFDMLRTIFSRGDHSGYSALVFHQAVQIWLLYLQPWTANTAGNITKDTRYTCQWDFYISQNLHFYTTLLGLFLHSVSLVSVHPTDPDGSAFLNSLEKVLKCFGGELLNKINQLMVGFNDWMEFELIQICLASHTNTTAGGATNISGSSGNGSIVGIFKPAVPVNKHNNNESNLIHRFATLSHHSLLFPDYSDKCIYSVDAIDVLSNSLLISANAGVTADVQLPSLQSSSTTTPVPNMTSINASIISTAEAKNKKLRVLHILRPFVEICRHDDDNNTINSYSSMSRLSTLAASSGVGMNNLLTTTSSDNININMNRHIKDDCMKILLSLQKMVKVDQESIALWLWEQLYDTFAEDEGGRRSREAAVYSAQIVMKSIEQLKNILSSSAFSSVTINKSKMNTAATAATSEANAIMNLNLSPRYAIDPLDTPLASYEWSFMVIITVTISKYLNSLFLLPRDQESIYRDWRSCLILAFQNFTQSTSTATTGGDTGSVNKNPIFALLGCIRVNLRILANITLLVCLCFLTILFVLYKLIRGDYSSWYVAIVTICFIIVMKGLQTVTKFYNQQSSSSLADTTTTAAALKIRDDVTNKLTEYGKQQLVSGNLICRKESIRYVGDSLDKPYCSYEIRWLTRSFILLSEWLNKRYGLPIENGEVSTSTTTTTEGGTAYDGNNGISSSGSKINSKSASGKSIASVDISNSSVTWTWQIIFTKAWNNRQFRNPVESILRCCRFNLRFLSNAEIVEVLIGWFVILYFIYPNSGRIIGVSVVVIMMILFGLLEYRLYRHRCQQQKNGTTTATTVGNS